VDERIDHERNRRRWIYRGVGLGLGVIGLLGMAQGFVELHHDGDHVVQAGQLYREDTSKGQAVFFTLGAAVVAAGVALVTIGWWPTAKTKKMAAVSLPAPMLPSARSFSRP
jgi:hypothetical protein